MQAIKTTVCAFALTGALAMVSGSGLAAEAKSDAKSDTDKSAKHIENRFKAADKNGDGKLSPAEADAGMPRVARNFSKIDKDKKGYVTVDQVKAFAAGDR